MGAAKNLVLGGSGTIGSALCSHLSGLGEEVTNLDIKSGFDLRKDSLDPYLDYHFVWFLAWDVGGAKYLTDPNRQHSMMLNNALICERVFSFLEKSKIPFLFSSSQLAAPDSAYGVSKLFGEHWTKLLDGTITRFWNVYGWEEPGEKSHVIPDLIIQGLTKKKISLLTTGEEERQFIFMDDCVKNLYRISHERSKLVHLTNGHWIRISEIAAAIGKMLDVPVELGRVVGYQNKIEPDPSYKNFRWDTSLENGLQILISKAKIFLTFNSASK